jgi:hypothetical protein
MAGKPKRAAKGRRKPSTSPARSRAARANGARGGRPRDRLPQDLVDELAAVPAKAADLELWRLRALALLFKAQISGLVGVELAASVRATLGEMRRNATAAPAPGDEDDDDDDDEVTGPELVSADTPLRIDP